MFLLRLFLLYATATATAETDFKVLKTTRNVTVLAPRGLTYSPAMDLCGQGTSCTEACGNDYEVCASRDEMLHCFDPVEGQVCCGDGSGSMFAAHVNGGT